jgi:hypothetical protein
MHLQHVLREIRRIDPNPSLCPALPRANLRKISLRRRTIETDENHAPITSIAGSQIGHKETEPVTKIIPIATKLTPPPLFGDVKL